MVSQVLRKFQYTLDDHPGLSFDGGLQQVDQLFFRELVVGRWSFVEGLMPVLMGSVLEVLW